MSRKWDAANFAMSIVGVCVTLTLLNEPHTHMKPLFALIAVLLVLRAVRYGLRLRKV